MRRGRPAASGCLLGRLLAGSDTRFAVLRSVACCRSLDCAALHPLHARSGKRHKRQKKERDSNKPPPSAYHLYVQSESKRLEQANKIPKKDRFKTIATVRGSAPACCVLPPPS